MSLLKREELINEAKPALTPLFDAFRKLSEEAGAWVEATLNDAPEIAAAGMDGIIRAVAEDNLHVVSGCIVLIGDNIAKAYVRERLGKNAKRSDYGEPVRNRVHFGRALQAGGNAFRHYDEWKNGKEPEKPTKDALDDMGITRFDISICFQILTLAKTTSEQSFIASLDVFCAEVDSADTTC